MHRRSERHGGHPGWHLFARCQDIDGDGLPDFVVGAPGAEEAHLYYGHATSRYVFGAAFVGEQTGDAFGRRVSLLGDPDGDTVVDIAVAAPENDQGLANEGLVRVYYPTAIRGEEAVTSATIAGVEGGARLGASLAGTAAGLFIGAPSAGPGYAYLFTTAPEGEGLASDADLVLSGDTASDKLGTSVARGDVDGDGYDDWAVGAPTPMPRMGWCTSGTMPPVPGWFLRGRGRRAGGAGFGDKVGTEVLLTDLDGDGRAELVIGGRYGPVYIVGADAVATMDLSADASFAFTSEAAGAGAALAPATDQDSDGSIELLIGSLDNLAWIGSTLIA